MAYPPSMKVLVSVLFAALVLAVPAHAAKPDPRIAALQRQVAKLQQTVLEIQRQQFADRSYTTCLFAVGQDSFKVVFSALSQLVKSVSGSSVPAWDQIPRYDDHGACANAGVPRP